MNEIKSIASDGKKESVINTKFYDNGDIKISFGVNEIDGDGEVRDEFTSKVGEAEITATPDKIISKVGKVETEQDKDKIISRVPQ